MAGPPVAASAPVASFEDDWEEYDPKSGLTFTDHMIAGSCAGLMEHVVMYPVDTLKTHMQASRDLRGGVAPHFREVWTQLAVNGGMPRLWRGVSTMFAAAIPAHAAYFSIYEAAKTGFGLDGTTHRPFAAAAAGALAVSVHDLVVCPWDVVKQRLQLGYYRGTWDSIASVARKEGLRAFFVAYPTTLFMNVPFHGIMVAANESLRKVLDVQEGGANSMGKHLVSGALAGAIAAGLTTPLDVAKTRLQTYGLHHHEGSRIAATSRAHGSVPAAAAAAAAAEHAAHAAGGRSGTAGGSGGGPTATGGHRSLITSVPPSSLGSAHLVTAVRAGGPDGMRTLSMQHRGWRRRRGIVGALRTIWIEDGAAGLMRGFGARMLLSAPSAAISWTTYEFVKSLLLRGGGSAAA